MAQVVEVWEAFRKKGGEPEEVVTLVLPSEIDRFIGADTYRERLRHLRRLRDEGLLIHGKRMLLQRVKGQGVERAYVFRCRADDVPTVADREPPRNPRVTGSVGRIRAI